VKPYAGHGITVGVETQDEQRDAVALFEVDPSQRPLKSAAAKDPFGFVEVYLPEIRSLQRMVALETNP
jgi:hypothetical protein